MKSTSRLVCQCSDILGVFRQSQRNEHRLLGAKSLLSHRNSEIAKLDELILPVLYQNDAFCRMKMDEDPISLTIPSYFDVKTCEHVSTYGTVLVAFDSVAGSCDCGVHGSKKGMCLATKCNLNRDHIGSYLWSNPISFRSQMWLCRNLHTCGAFFCKRTEQKSSLL